MKRFLFFPLIFLTCSLFAQVSFKNETRSFTQMGLTTNEQIARYLNIELSDLLSVFQHSSIEGHGPSISPANFYEMISESFSTKDIQAFQRICRELGVTFERFFLVFSRETGEIDEEDLQMMLAMYRIGVKWGIISP